MSFFEIMSPCLLLLCTLPLLDANRYSCSPRGSKKVGGVHAHSLIWVLQSRLVDGRLATTGHRRLAVPDHCIAMLFPPLETSVMDDFIEAASFEGSKDGYVFKMGRNGLGYYVDGVHDDFDVNAGMVPVKVKEYDMEAHARGEAPEAEKAKEPGHGRVGTLGELLAGLLPIPKNRSPSSPNPWGSDLTMCSSMAPACAPS